MARSQDEPIIPTWDGEVSGWTDYYPRVRLCYTQTPKHKRELLGAKLVLKLKGKAWEIAATVDHEQLATSGGTQYLMQFLHERLGRLPIPDLGQHLDDLFVRLRRQYGTDMVSWSNQLRETYRKLQRSLARTRPPAKSIGVQTEEDRTAWKSKGASSQVNVSGSEPHHEPSEQGGEKDEEAVGEQSAQESPLGRSRSRASGRSEPEDASEVSWWSQDAWYGWGGWGSGGWYNSDWYGSWYDEPEEEVEWDQQANVLPEVLPEEILGWLLLRRSGLPSSAKLAIHAATSNSMKFSDIERAMRRQEDELLHQERNKPSGNHQRSGRTFWVEQNDEWGLVLADMDESESLADEQIKWVSADTFATLLPGLTQDDSNVSDPGMTMMTDGTYDWSWHDDEWFAHTPDGLVAFSEMKPWLDIEDVNWVDPTAGREIQDLYANFDQKLRTFREARDLVHQKGKSRGYYPIHQKGSKSKKGNHKGKKGSSNVVLWSAPGKGKGSSSSSIVNKPGYTGCFVCGDSGHDWRNCPKRGTSSSSGGPSKAKHINFVEEVFMVNEAERHTGGNEESCSSDAISPADIQRLILAAAGGPHDPHRLGYAVIDTGATETVGSLEAIEYIMNSRSSRFPNEKVGVDVSRRKRFRFGNAEERQAESFLVLPQTVGGLKTSLGVYTLDVPGVPVLLGIKTMEKLGAIVNVASRTLEFQSVFPGLKIPLVKAQNGHLLLDLCMDWNPEKIRNPNNTCHPNQPGSETVQENMCLTSKVGKGEEEMILGVQVDVVETKSDTESEVSASPILQEFLSQTIQAAQDLADHEPSLALLDSGHGALSRDLEGQLGTGEVRGDHESYGAREGRSEVQTGSELREVRLGTGGMVRQKGSENHQRSMLGPSRDSQPGKGITFRGERTCSMAMLSEMHAQDRICPHMGVHGGPSQCRPSECRHQQEDQGFQGGGLCPGAAQDEGHRSRRSGGVSSSQVGAGADEEASNERGDNNYPQGQSSELGISSDRGGEESPPQRRGHSHDGRQEGSPQVSRATREGGDRGHSMCRRMAEGQPLRVDQKSLMDDALMSQEDHMRVHDDAILSQERKDSVDICTVDVSQREKEVITEALKAASDRIEECLSQLETSCCDLLEVCCSENSLLTEVINNKGGKAYRVGLSNKMDMSTHQGVSRACEFAEIVRPRWLWFSIPCGPTSPLQNMNQNSPEQIERLRLKVKKTRKIIRGCIQLAKQHLARGGQLCWEWPFNNAAWQFREVREFFRELHQEGCLFSTRLDGCQVGVVAHDSGLPMLKPWSIQTTSHEMNVALSRRCKGTHQHETCQGHSRAFHSGQYPKQMCEIISRVVMNSDFRKEHIFGVETLLKETPSDHQTPWDEKKFKESRELVRKLHVNFGHPTNKALVNCLKARGVDPRILQLASEHRCDDCKEVHLPAPHRKVTLHDSHVLWHTLQVDIGQLNFGEETLHIMIMVDEASRFMSAWELFRHHKSESRNCTSQEAIHAIERAWVQYHGYPNLLRTDPEGCFRGTIFESWCTSRGIEHQPCPAEDHSQIGVVEAMIKKVKEDARTLLRSLDQDPFSGVLHVVSAHNHLDRVGGYAPSQWAYGRLPSFDNRLFEGGNDLPYHTAEGQVNTDLRANLQIRIKAEEIYRKTQAALKISRALNAKPNRSAVFLPGDLVYYRRYKVPAQPASHPGLDQARVGVARWYGPARVLATETKSEYEPFSKKPGSTVWIIGGGRLKRCSPFQLRHCSDREKLLAESSEAVTMPWSFNTLMHLVERGQFETIDDLQTDELAPEHREAAVRSAGRSRSRARAVSEPRTRKASRGEQRPQKEPIRETKKKEKVEEAGPQQTEERRLKSRPKPPGQEDESRKKRQKEDEKDQKNTPMTVDQPGGQEVSSSSAGTGPLFERPPFQAAQRRQVEKVEIETKSLSELLRPEKALVVDGEAFERVYHIEVDLPETKKEMKHFTQDAESWVAKKVKKSAELRWHDIPHHKLEDFRKAKDKEVSSWVRESAVKLVNKEVPANRIMKMRWLYTTKTDGSAKARIVIVGFTDPDLGQIPKTSPTMSRRTRGLVLTACSTVGWTVLKGDVKAAFLQGQESEEQRQIFAKPVKELNERLGGSEKSLVQIIKACYGLANAPAQWYQSVTSTMQQAGFEQLQSEPCCWRLMDRSDQEHPQLIGLACAHVDDFLFGGESDHPEWQRAISAVYDSYKWSDWEVDCYQHCGVSLTQQVNGNITLSQADYCTTIEQISIKSREYHRQVTDEEKQQLRGVLGALQWRVYQTAPQHGARLSALQSQLASPTVQTLLEANKLVKEVYAHRHINLQYRRLDVKSLEDITFIAWTDAAVGNRRDLSSSGGYVIGATEPRIAEGIRSQVNLVSWKAGKLPRVARSSLAAEIQAFSIAEEELMYVRLQWLEMIGADIPMHDPASMVQRAAGIMVTDARSLFDVIEKGPTNTSGLGLKEKYSVLDMLSVFQRLAKCKTETRWVHSEAQIADAMTKHVPGSSLIRLIQDGTWTLVYDPTFTSSKNLRKRAKMLVSAEDCGACQIACVLESDLPPLAYFSHFFKR